MAKAAEDIIITIVTVVIIVTITTVTTITTIITVRIVVVCSPDSPLLPRLRTTESALKYGDSRTATCSNQNRYQANQRLHLCIVTIIAEDRPLTAHRCIKDMVAIAVIVLPVYNNHT